MILRSIIDKTSFRVKRYGYVEFSARPDFDPDTEEEIVKDWDFSAAEAWVWNPTEEIFEETTPLPVYKYHSSSKLVERALDVTEISSWEDLGGTVTTVGAFITDVTKAVGRVVGQVRTNGAGAKLQVVRESDGLPVSQVQEIPDTEDSWTNVQFWATDNQTLQTDCFILQGQRNGVGSFQVRFFSISLLEKIK